MAYSRTNWVDRYIQTPNRYVMTQNQDNTVTLTESTGTVYAEGTEVNAEHMNNIEEGILQNESDINATNVKMVGTILYDNPTGSRDAIQLSQSAENYDYLEIFYRSNDNQYASTKIDSPNGKLASLIVNFSSSQYAYFKTKLISISGRDITNSAYSEVRLGASGNTFNESNNIYITKIIGYKY